MGFGFVEYASKDGAANAVKTLQGVKLDGHVLELKMAKNQPAAASREQTVWNAMRVYVCSRNDAVGKSVFPRDRGAMYVWFRISWCFRVVTGELFYVMQRDSRCCNCLGVAGAGY
jgi:RNA recognition motif-containing protein